MKCYRVHVTFGVTISGELILHGDIDPTAEFRSYANQPALGPEITSVCEWQALHIPPVTRVRDVDNCFEVLAQGVIEARMFVRAFDIHDGKERARNHLETLEFEEVPRNMVFVGPRVVARAEFLFDEDGDEQP